MYNQPHNNTKNVIPILGAIGVVAALIAYQGWLLLSALAFLIVVLLSIATLPVSRIPFSWQFGIPTYYCGLLFFIPILNRIIGESPVGVSDEEIAVAFMVLSAGVFSFALGAKFAIKFTIGITARRFSNIGGLEVLNKPWALVVLIFLGMASTVWSYLFGYYGLQVNKAENISALSGLISALTFFVTIAHVIAWTNYLKGREREYLIIGLISTMVMFISGVMSNSKGQLIGPFILIAICYWGIAGKFPFRQAVVGVLVYLLIAYPFITSLRSGLLSSVEYSSRMDLAAGMIDQLFDGDWIFISIQAEATASMGRGLLEYFAQIVNESGVKVEYFYGETYIRGLQVLIPRFIYPDKPDMDIGNWTAQAFGAINAGDSITNLSPTFVGEFYMNFGIAGVLVGMFMLGTIAVLVDQYIIVDNGNWTMPIMMLGVLWQESFIGHTLLPFLKTALILVPMLFVLNILSKLTIGSSGRRRGLTAGSPL